MSTEPQLGKYVPLRMVVAFFSDQYDKSEGDQDRFWILGLRALVELNFDISAEPKTVRLPINPNKTVNFPIDCLQWTKIGLLNQAGEVSTLKINNGFTNFRDNNPNRIADLVPNINDSTSSMVNAPFFFNYWYNDGYYNLFGSDNGLVQYGECSVDDGNQLVVLPIDFRYENILFEYISSPERDTDYKVPLALQEAIIAFIAWKLKLDTAQNYYGEVTKSRRRLGKKKVTLQTINQVIRESNGMKLRS